MNELQGGGLFLIRDTICPSCRKLVSLSVIHAGDVFLGMGQVRGTPSKGPQEGSSLRWKLGPHNLCSVSALRFCNLSKCDENSGNIALTGC